MTLSTLDHGQMARWVELAGPAAQLAERIAETEFVPRAMRGKPAVVAAAILYGDEIGLGPMQALAGIDVVEGRPRPSAELMRALILRDGHTIAVHEFSGTRVRVSGLRAGRPEQERVVVEWTIDMARAAGLLNKTNWRSYPRAMLLARATSDLARVLFSDVIKGLGYIIEDTEEGAAALEAWGPAAEQTETEPVKKPRKALQRARKPRAAPEPQPEPAEPPEPPAEPPAARSEPVAPQPESVPAEQPTVERRGDAPSAPLGRDDGPNYEPPPMPGTSRRTIDVPLPELVPETPPVEPQTGPGPAMIDARPLKALHTALGKHLGTVATREEKLSMVSAIVGHEVANTKDLTRAEGWDCLAFLDRVDTGEAAYYMDPVTGTVQITELEPDDPPDEPESDEL